MLTSEVAVKVTDDARDALREAETAYKTADRAHNVAMRNYKVAYCVQHGVEEGKDIMLKAYQHNSGSAPARRRARIEHIHVNGLSVVFHVRPYTATGEIGARRSATSVTEEGWEHVDGA